MPTWLFVFFASISAPEYNHPQNVSTYSTPYKQLGDDGNFLRVLKRTWWYQTFDAFLSVCSFSLTRVCGGRPDALSTAVPPASSASETRSTLLTRPAAARSIARTSGGTKTISFSARRILFSLFSKLCFSPPQLNRCLDYAFRGEVERRSCSSGQIVLLGPKEVLSLFPHGNEATGK